jgi:hypothetical protein
MQLRRLLASNRVGGPGFEGSKMDRTTNSELLQWFQEPHSRTYVRWMAVSLASTTSGPIKATTKATVTSQNSAPFLRVMPRTVVAAR